MYLSRGLRGVNLPDGTLTQLAAASSRLFVEEVSRIGARVCACTAPLGPSPSRVGHLGAIISGVALVRRVGLAAGIRAGVGGMWTSGISMRGISGVCWADWGWQVGVAGGVGELSCMKSTSGKGGGVPPGSEDWYATIGVAGGSCCTTSIGTDRDAMTGVGLCLSPSVGNCGGCMSYRGVLARLL